MRISKTSQLLLTLTLALILAACGGAGADDTAPTPIPTNTAIPLAPESGPSNLDLDDPEAFQEFPGDYTLTMDFSFEGENDDGADASGNLLLIAASQAEPHALSMDISASGAADLGGVDHVNYVELDDRIYFWNAQNGCANLPANSEQGLLFNDFVNTDNFLTGIAQRMLPDATINGVASYHFVLSPENLDVEDPETMDVSELTNGSIYVARDGGYIVRMLLQGTGVSQLISAEGGPLGQIDYQLDFEPAPDGVSISPPEGCAEDESQPVDYPVLDDATNPTSFGGFYSYQTEKSFDVAVDFYLTRLAEDGWTLEENNSAGGTAAMLFSKDGTRINVVISPVADGALNIILAEEP